MGHGIFDTKSIFNTATINKKYPRYNKCVGKYCHDTPVYLQFGLHITLVAEVVDDLKPEYQQNQKSRVFFHVPVGELLALMMGG